MTFEITPFVIISFIGAAIASVVTIAASRRFTTPGGKSLFWLMLAATIWACGATLEHATIGIPGQVFWSKIEYIGTTSCPVLLLTFAMEYNNQRQWLTQRNLILMFVIPFITLLLAATNEWHHLIWTGFTASPDGNNLTIFSHGPWFWIGGVGYSYLAMLVGTVLLIRGVIGLPSAYRSQVILIMIAALAPWIVNIVYISGWSPAAGLELTPLVIVFSGSTFAWAIFRFHLLDLVPIARHMLIETMADGMLVLDQQKRLVDMNPAAQKLLGDRVKIRIGAYVGDVFGPWPDLKDVFVNSDPLTRAEQVLDNGTGEYIELSLAPIIDGRRRQAGQFVVLRDITEKRRIQDELQRANDSLRIQLEEVQILQETLNERAIRDSLTGLYNRRYLDETLERELSRAGRESYVVSLLMIDLDHFKRLNDTYGHKAGDRFLKMLANFLTSKVRQGDIVCRYGGEEFLIIMPTVQIEDARNRAEMLCKEFNQLTLPFENRELRCSISIGVATFPNHGSSADEIVNAADSAMYTAKQAGRNTVRVK